MKDEDRYRTILGSGLGPWLISDRPKGCDFESFREGRSARDIASVR